VKINLTGWKAAGVLVAIGGVALVKLGMRSDALGTEGVDAIERWLAVESSRDALPAMQGALTSGSAEELSRMTEELLQRRFEVLALNAHGISDDIVVRVEYKSQRSATDDEVRVRFFRMSYSPVAGWRVGAETTKLGYYLAIF